MFLIWLLSSILYQDLANTSAKSVDNRPFLSCQKVKSAHITVTVSLVRSYRSVNHMKTIRLQKWFNDLFRSVKRLCCDVSALCIKYRCVLHLW